MTVELRTSHARWLWSAATLSSVLTCATAALATGPTLPLRVLPVVRAEAGSPGSLQFTIEALDLAEIDVESTIVSDGVVIEETKFVGASVVSREELGSERPAPDGLVVIERDGLLELKVPREKSLPEGIYAERLIITLLQRSADAPTELASFRYFVVNQDGVQPISAEDYSSKLEHVEVDGRLRMHIGIALKDPESAEGRVTGFDVPHDKQRPIVNTDFSEVNEK